MKNILFFLLVALIFGAIVGVTTSYITTSIVLKNEDSEEALMEKFYLTENVVYVSPHSLRLRMDENREDYILVDLRSQEEYEKEHIIGAINIPVYKDKQTPAYNEEERIVQEFLELPKNREIIVYCYSMPCMSGRKIGKLLAENGIYVKQLGIGWNEWRYFWDLWNHEYEWNITNVSDYIGVGKEAGKPKLKNTSTSCSVYGGC